MQRNSFYRVNKATGDSARSYVNGENLPSFQPNVTGFVSRRRKVYLHISRVYLTQPISFTPHLPTLLTPKLRVPI